ncbi:MAG: sugar phosphate isomerase/epimerase [Clostridia bacterium]|nr:sugar phosphate isomerase/epimerase [Clostridia bacterium]
MLVSIHPGRIFERFGIDEGFRMLRENGIEGIQFCLRSAGLSVDQIKKGLPGLMDEPLEIILEQMLPYRAAAQKHGVAVSQAHAPYPSYVYGLEGSYERMQEVLKKSIAVTEFMGAPYCVIHPPFDADAFAIHTREEEWALCRRVYEPLIPYLKKQHVTALLENMFSRAVEGERFAAACSDFDQAGRWIDDLNALAGEECFGFCFDTGHCFLTRQNLYRSIVTVGRRIKAVHLQDNNGHLDDHLTPYTGRIDWENVIRALIDIGYGGDLNYESMKGLDRFPPELEAKCLQLQAQVGNYMRGRILAARA